MPQNFQDVEFMMNMDKDVRSLIKKTFDLIDSNENMWGDCFTKTHKLIQNKFEQKIVESANTPHIQVFNIFYDGLDKLKLDEIKEQLLYHRNVFETQSE